MNYFAHALPFLTDPWLAAATGIPDWLSVSDRLLRVRAPQALRLMQHATGTHAAVARGTLQHLRDDAVFHATPVFATTMYELTALFRDALAGERGLRPWFLGHLLTELLLDAALIDADPAALETYYRQLDALDPAVFAAVVGLMTGRPPQRLAWFVAEFRRARILWDYGDNAKLMNRVNQVLRRVGLAPLPPGFAACLAAARVVVSPRCAGLLAGTPAPLPEVPPSA